MSIKNTIAAGLTAALTAAAVPASAKGIEECPNQLNPYDPQNIAGDLFSNKVENWDMEFLKSLNAYTIDVLQNEADDAHSQISRATDRVVQGIARTLEDNKEPRWERILENAHPVIKPSLEKIQAGEATVDEATVEIRNALTAYETDYQAALAKIAEEKSTVCTIRPAGAPAPQPTNL